VNQPVKPRRRTSRLIDLTGEVFGDLTVLSYEGYDRNHSWWKCRCVCGAVKLVAGHELRRGKAVSCGCRRARRTGKSEAGRVCKACGLWKPVSDFSPVKYRTVQGTKLTLKSRCKHCMNSKQVADREAWTEEVRRRRSFRGGLYKPAVHLGTTVEQLAAILEEHGPLCDICGQPTRSPNRRLSFDHDHRTGKLRGLLCDDCNHGIGKFKDDVALLRKVIAYLERT